MSACVRAYFVVCHLQACQQRYVSERPPARFQTSSADEGKNKLPPVYIHSYLEQTFACSASY